MSLLLILNGIIGFSMIVVNNRTVSSYKSHIKENEIISVLTTNILILESDLYEYLLTDNENRLIDYEFRNAKVRVLLKQVEKIHAPQIRSLLGELKNAIDRADILFAKIRMFGQNREDLRYLFLEFQFIKNNLEISNNSMKLISDDIERDQNRIAHTALIFVIALLVLEVLLIAITGIIFLKVILRPIQNLQTLLMDIINSMPSILVGVNEDGRVALWNDKVENKTGIKAKEAVNRDLFEVYPFVKDYETVIWKSIREKRIFSETDQRQGMDDEVHYYDITIFPFTSKGTPGAVLRIDDVTVKTRMTELILQSEKILSGGGLAAGIAHEINNPLAGMIQSAELIKLRLGKERGDEEWQREVIRSYLNETKIPEMVEQIYSAGLRVAELVSGMLSFSRKDDNLSVPHTIPDLIEDTILLANADFSLKKDYDFRNIEIIRHFDENLPMVLCEKSRIQQVILNLLRNGSQAMHDFHTGNPHFDIHVSSDLNAGLVHIEIADNGPGMSEKVKSRIFEPFFTTKPQGEGTGLGLSVSKYIVTELHHGTMAVESAEGKGTLFRINLPAHTIDQ